MTDQQLAMAAALAFTRLAANDRRHIIWKRIPDVIKSYVDKRTRVHDTGEAIRYTLTDHYINGKSREVFSAWARLLRKFENEVGLADEDRDYPPIRDNEITAVMAHLRKDKRYASMMPADDAPRFDKYMFRKIADEIARRRRPGIKLMFLAGTVVRELIPDVDSASRALGQAYKSGMSKVFTDRKMFQDQRRAAQKQIEHPEAPPMQPRLI